MDDDKFVFDVDWAIAIVSAVLFLIAVGWEVWP